MATNKHATIRYKALDNCFSNFGRKFFIDDLIEACNVAIYDFAGIEDGVKRRQVFDDITFMESEQGWAIPLERHKEGKRVYYRYKDKSFSISNKGINQSEAEQLKETLSILSRFKGIPQFEWVEEIQVRLEDTFKLKGNNHSIVSFEQNPFLKGLNHFTQLFNAIQNKQVLEVAYQGYRQETEIVMIIHPWHLKQYNNRWFLFGYNNEFEALSNLALDRIEGIKDSKVNYLENEEINFDEFFEDVVGVSVNPSGESEKVLLKISDKAWPYITSKPLHESQKFKSDLEGNIIELDIQVNHEFFALLFSHMDGVEVLEPSSLRKKFEDITKSILSNY